MRYFFEISYHGANYSGWQSQPNAVGIQAVVEDCLSKILRQSIAVVGSGRTDAGVHCRQQFFHSDIEPSFDGDELVRKMNSFLPWDIAIHSIHAVRPDANARYDAIERSYEYHIVRTKNPFRRGLAWYFFKPLDIENMNAAAALLVGKHDFQCFSKVKTDVNNFICDVKEARWVEQGEYLIFHVTANRFLRGMVRAIVGTLTDVGQGRSTMDKFKEILLKGDRKEAGANVPPEGLYLASVKYPDATFHRN